MDENKIKEAKDKLLGEIDSWLATDDQKAATKEQIKAMPNEEFASWMKKHGML